MERKDHKRKPLFLTYLIWTLSHIYEPFHDSHYTVKMKRVCEINSSKIAVTVVTLKEFFLRKREVISCINIHSSCTLELLAL